MITATCRAAPIIQRCMWMTLAWQSALNILSPMPTLIQVARTRGARWRLPHMRLGESGGYEMQVHTGAASSLWIEA